MSTNLTPPLFFREYFGPSGVAAPRGLVASGCYPSKPFQGVPNRSKPFSEKKDCLFAVAPRIPWREGLPTPSLFLFNFQNLFKAIQACSNLFKHFWPLPRVQFFYAAFGVSASVLHLCQTRPATAGLWPKLTSIFGSLLTAIYPYLLLLTLFCPLRGAMVCSWSPHREDWWPAGATRQSISKGFKEIQSVSKVFQKKKIVYFLGRWGHLCAPVPPLRGLWPKFTLNFQKPIQGYSSQFNPIQALLPLPRGTVYLCPLCLSWPGGSIFPSAFHLFQLWPKFTLDFLLLLTPIYPYLLLFTHFCPPRGAMVCSCSPHREVALVRRLGALAGWGASLLLLLFLTADCGS
jgi:hypothetical protein